MLLNIWINISYWQSLQMISEWNMSNLSTFLQFFKNYYSNKCLWAWSGKSKSKSLRRLLKWNTYFVCMPLFNLLCYVIVLMWEHQNLEKNFFTLNYNLVYHYFIVNRFTFYFIFLYLLNFLIEEGIRKFELSKICIFSNFFQWSMFSHCFPLINVTELGIFW